MSLNGLIEYNDNITKIQKSEPWKKSDTKGKLNIMYRLLNSKYGTRSIKVKEIKQ